MSTDSIQRHVCGHRYDDDGQRHRARLYEPCPACRRLRHLAAFRLRMEELACGYAPRDGGERLFWASDPGKIPEAVPYAGLRLEGLPGYGLAAALSPSDSRTRHRFLLELGLEDVAKGFDLNPQRLSEDFAHHNELRVVIGPMPLADLRQYVDPGQDAAFRAGCLARLAGHATGMEPRPSKRERRIRRWGEEAAARCAAKKSFSSADRAAAFATQEEQLFLYGRKDQYHCQVCKLWHNTTPAAFAQLQTKENA